jgi:hypothetical protein
MKIAVFWVITPCSLVQVYRRFRDACCLRHQAGALMIEAASRSGRFVRVERVAISLG